MFFNPMSHRGGGGVRFRPPYGNYLISNSARIGFCQFLKFLGHYEKNYNKTVNTRLAINLRLLFLKFTAFSCVLSS